MSFFSLIVYLVAFITKNKRHFLTCMLAHVFNFKTYDGTTINNEDRKEFYIRKDAKTSSIL